jgi:hypothetical protein
MSRLFFVSHPVAGRVDSNLMAAMRWVVDVMTGNDADPVRREKGLLDCERIVARCDGIVLCGGRISSGMQRELNVALKYGLLIADLTSLGAEPEDIDALLAPIEFGMAMWRAKMVRPVEAAP